MYTHICIWNVVLDDYRVSGDLILQSMVLSSPENNHRVVKIIPGCGYSPALQLKAHIKACILQIRWYQGPWAPSHRVEDTL